VTVKRENGLQASYDPHRFHGVTLYRQTERGFSQGDRCGTGCSRIVHSVRIGPPQPIDEFREITGRAWCTARYTIEMSKTVLQ
jgi:hypothetical protein